MTHFRLIFHATSALPERVIEFDAPDAAAALIQAHREASDRAAELWEEDRRLCAIKRTPVGHDDAYIWRITAANA